MTWLPLDPNLLRIGLYIKVDHSWMEHPFVRNIFTVSSPTEIVIIAGQTETLQEATKVLTAMANVLEHEAVAISLVSTDNQADPEQTLAMQAMNVSTLSTLTAKTLGLSNEEIKHVGMAPCFIISG